MKRSLFKRTIAMVLAAVCLGTTTVAAQAEDMVDIILSTGTTQAFTKEAVADADLNRILEAGLSATSAMNKQPWFFAVVSNREIMDEIAGSMGFGGGAPGGVTPPGDAKAGSDLPKAPAPPATSGSAKAALGDSPVAIILYMDDSSAMGNPAFDCGLACQNMVIAASTMGYGVKIVSSPTMALNGENHDALCEKLGVDTALKAVAVLLIGHHDESVDAVSSATTRSSMDEKVATWRRAFGPHTGGKQVSKKVRYEMDRPGAAPWPVLFCGCVASS